jgi:cytochrome c oxidase subunit 2
MAIVIILLVVGSVAFHFLSPWWFTPIASNWTMMDTTVDITFWVTGIVFVAVNLFMAYAIIRFRHRKGQRALYEPENKKLEWWLTIVTTVGVIAMLTPGLFVWADFVNVPKDAVVVEAVGRQWNWSFRLPGPDGVLGATSAEFTTPENPFGVDPEDPKGFDDVLVPDQELHLALNQPVKLLLRSTDVLHNFTVTQFRVKMDLVPGMVTYVWLTPTRTGSFEILCEELCGMAHFAMRGRVVVDEPDAYRDWLASQVTVADSVLLAAADPVAGEAAYATCLACHGARGEGNPVLNAPKLAGQASWYLARQLHNFKHGIRGAGPDDVYGQQMVGFAGILDAAATRNLLAYVQKFPDERPEATLGGDPVAGEKLYTTCAGCHGPAGEGIWTTRAPRLAQMQDWYLVRQLQNFRKGIRGGHPRDFEGAQMALLSDALDDDTDVADVTAYIRTLRLAAPAMAANDLPDTVRMAQR